MVARSVPIPRDRPVEEYVPMLASTLMIIAQSAVAEAASGDNVDISRGYSIAIAGLIIVFTALMLISLFIASLPRVLAAVSRVWPETEEVHVRQGLPESQAREDGAVLAAICYVLHTEMQRQLALDETSQKKA